MSDLTVYAEALVSTVARAFYSDEEVVLIDVLIRDKFLRDDDMSPRLGLPARKLRSALQFLQEEHLVAAETVDDLAQGGSQATKFYYIDFCRAVHSIRLRLHLLQRKLEQAELRARSSSFYLCPGYSTKRCNGRYTEEEAQRVLDPATGLFLCQECSLLFENDPNRPDSVAYTLQLVDNTAELKKAMDNLRRVQVQLSAKYIGNDQLRAGVYDLLQKVRVRGRTITSNLPSENFALGIGSKRLAGTGRTAGIKAKKLEQSGVARTADQALDYLVGGGGAARGAAESEPVFLKNAMGQEVQFTVERGGGARAQLLAARRRRRRKLMDAAASRVGASVPLVQRIQEQEVRKRKAEEEKRREDEKAGKAPKSETLEFLRDSIGQSTAAAYDSAAGHPLSSTVVDEADDSVDSPIDEPELVLSDDHEELRQLSEENRLNAFQAQYKLEMDRQTELLHLGDTESPRHGAVDDDDELLSILWEDGN